jgi:hypothetical protein
MYRRAEDMLNKTEEEEPEFWVGVKTFAIL